MRNALTKLAHLLPIARPAHCTTRHARLTASHVNFVASAATMSKRTLLQRRAEEEREGTPAAKATKQQETPHRLEVPSCPPSASELSAFRDVPLEELPKSYKRQDEQRVFCNRTLDLREIRYFGFDMDFTLAEYVLPAINTLTFTLVIERLIEMGYPDAIATFKFDPDFAIRGLIFDVKHGNFLKTDAYGYILQVCHGTKTLTEEEKNEVDSNLFYFDHFSKYYPVTFLHSSEIGSSRFCVLNTLFGVPETTLIALIIDYFDNAPGCTKLPSKTAIRRGATVLSYESMHNDLRTAVDKVHDEGYLKNAIVGDLDKYVIKQPQLPVLLDRIQQHGKGSFLVTNSDYRYTNTIMSFLFNASHPENMASKEWTEYFDLIIVSACKPTFFKDEGTALREVDQRTGRLKLGEFAGKETKGKIFAGGSANQLTSMLDAHGRDILYVGDHIFGDVLKSKKLSGWRTFLVVPELERELKSLQQSRNDYEHIRNLEFMLAETHRGLASDQPREQAPDISELRKDLEKTADAIDMSFNKQFGSIFRTGQKQSLFASQAADYADLYSSSFNNLINYPLFYLFHASMDILPHEARAWKQY